MDIEREGGREGERERRGGGWADEWKGWEKGKEK
jgi:hypothetical protein